MLHQIMKFSADAANMQFEVLDRVTQNVANLNTNGYKIKRFDQYLRSDGVVSGIERFDYTQGSIMVTQRQLDVALKGEGFIPVTQPDGQKAFTRDGSFTRNSEGMIITNYGDVVGSGIQLPVNYKKIIITEQGEVKVQLHNKLKPELLGKIKLVNFANPEGLESIGQNKLVPTKKSGEAEAMADKMTLFKQGSLERSNVNVFAQVDEILRLNAGLLSNMKIVKFTDDVYRQATNLKQ